MISAVEFAYRKIPWVFWLQDLHSLAMGNEVVRRIGQAGRPFATMFEKVERELLRRATAVVPITADFDSMLDQWGVDAARSTVIENWAPLIDLPERPLAPIHGGSEQVSATGSSSSTPALSASSTARTFYTLWP